MRNVLTKNFKAGTDLERYRLVMPSATVDGECDYPAAGYVGPLFVTEEAASENGNVACIPLDAFTGTILLTCSAAVARLGKVCLAGAVGKVDDSGLGMGIGVALQATTEDGEAFEVAVKAGTGLYHAAIASSSAVTAAVATTFDNANKTIDGASLRVGDILRIKAAGILTTSTGSETTKVDLLVGTEIVMTTGAVDSTSADMWRLEADVVVRVTGASGKLQSHGTYAIGAPGTATALPFCSAELSEDISGAALPVICRVTHSSTGESNLCHAFSVELIRN